MRQTETLSDPCVPEQCEAVLTVNLLIKDAAGRTLLQFRDSKAAYAPLAWGFWGGAIDSIDDNAFAVAQRELFEELNVKSALADLELLDVQIDPRMRLAALLHLRTPLSWRDIEIDEGAGGSFFWLAEMKHLCLTPSVARYVELRPDLFV